MANDPVADPYFVSLGGDLLLSCWACGFFLLSLLPYIVLGVKSAALYHRMNLGLHFRQGREEVACVVQIILRNREEKQAFDTGFTARQVRRHGS